MARTIVLVLCAVVPLCGIGLAVRYGPHVDPSAPHAGAATSAAGSSSAAPRLGPPNGIRVEAPHANGDATVPPDLPSLRVGIDEDAALRKKLAQVVDLDLTDVPLDAVLEKLAKVAGVNIVIDRPALAEEEIDPEIPIGFQGGGRELGDALRTALDAHHLEIIVKDRVVHVTTEVKAAGSFVTRLYDLQAFRKFLEPQASEPPERHGRAERVRSPNEVPLVEAVFVQFGREPLPPGPLDRVVDVLVECTSGPWLEGQAGTIFVCGDLLVVRHARPIHDQIESLLPILLYALEGRLEHGAADASTRSRRDRIVDAAIGAKLEQPIDVDFRATPLDAALDSLGERLGFRVRIDRTALRDEGLRPDEPVTLKVEAVPARSVLALLLEPLNMTAGASDAALVVTSIEAAKDLSTTSVYDVRDLADRFSSRELSELLELATEGHRLGWHGWGRASCELAKGIRVVRCQQRFHGEIRKLIASLRIAGEGRPPRTEPALTRSGR